MPPVVLQIVVDDSKGTPQIRVFDKAVSDTAKTVQQSSQSTTQAAKSTDSFTASLTSSAKAAVGLAAGFAGVQGIVATLSAAATAATGFEAALNAIAALGTVSTGQISKLREQLLALPPALGSSTELAKGLYDILGANVPAENAITVLTQSAELAKGGLGQLDTAINAVTKSAAAFGIPLEQAQFITDVFTQTVVRGQGRLEEFANAFPQVAATAAAAGASFIDTNAAMAVLTQTFKNADTAATGLNSFLQQLIQNSAKLAAEGINVKAVLAEGGLAGLFERLNQVTGGSAERLKELINDSEGFRAALTLTGTQLGTFNETVQSYSNVTGLAQQAAQKNLSGATASWTTFLNTLDRLVQEVAPPLLSAFTSLTGVLATLAAAVTKLYRAFAESETLQQLTADLRTFLGILGETSVVQGFTAAMQELNTTLLTTSSTTGNTYNAFETLDQLLRGNIVPTVEFVSAAWDLLNAAFNATIAAFLRFGQSAVQVVTPLAQVIAALDETATKLGVSDGRFRQLGDSVKGVATDLGEAAAIFEEQAEAYVLGTTRMQTAQATLQAQVGQTTKSVQQQTQTLPGQQKAAEGSTKATEQLTEAQQAANKVLQDANTAATTFKSTLEKLKPGDVLKAIPADELNRAVKQVIENLTQLEQSGQFTAREIRQAYEQAAEVLRARFGVLPEAFQRIYDQIVSFARLGASGIQQAFTNFGIQTRAELQKLATDALADFQAIEQAGTATPQALLDAFLDVVDKIDKGAFKTLPEGFQATAQRMQEIARKLGEELPRPIVNAFGEIEFATTKAATAIDTSLLQTRGALERAAGATDTLALSTAGLTDKQLQLGYAITTNGELVNAYGNAVARLTEETQKLLNLQIDVKTPFATTLEGLQEQLRQANRDLLNLPNRISDLGFAGFEQQQKILQQLIAELEKRIAELQAQQASTGTGTGTGTGTVPGTGTGTGTGIGTSPGIGTTAPVAGITPASPVYLQRPGAPTSGSTTALPVTTQRSVTVNVSLNAQMLTADRATIQQAVNQLAPAINEAIRRGAITL